MQTLKPFTQEGHVLEQDIFDNTKRAPCCFLWHSWVVTATRLCLKKKIHVLPFQIVFLSFIHFYSERGRGNKVSYNSEDYFVELVLSTFSWVLEITFRLSGLCRKQFYLVNHLADPVIPTFKLTDKTLWTQAWGRDRQKVPGNQFISYMIRTLPWKAWRLVCLWTHHCLLLGVETLHIPYTT